MPRRGLQKVRTGCITCKIRKVKCDEARPQCARCRTTGRRCDGYKEPPPGSFSWDDLLRAQPSRGPGKDLCRAELRGLDVFRLMVAPVLSGPLNDTFWTRLVIQVAHQEPAARHAVVAISSLFEQFDKQEPRKDQPQNFAIGHYNNAIRHIATSKTPSVDSVLVISILFTCIELLRGNTEAAISHCRNGIQIFNSCPSNSGLSANFNRLSIFPFFFGETVSSHSLPRSPSQPTRGSFQTLSDAQQSLDSLMARSVRFVRSTDPYRFCAMTTLDTFSALLLQQQELHQELGSWSCAASKIWNEQDSLMGDATALRLLEIQWLVCKTWTSICLCRDEMASDGHKESFERIVELATQETASKHSSMAKPAKFIFGMGFSPLLYFVVIKCRDLPIRLAALSLVKTLSCAREFSWDADILYCTGLRIVELEHGFELTPEPTGEIQDMGNPSCHFPADAQRVRDSRLEKDTYEYMDHHGRQMTRQKISIFYPSLDGTGIRTVQDWITIPRIWHCNP